MITAPYLVRPSRISMAGRGLFLAAPVPRGRVIVAPSGVEHTLSVARLLATPDHPHSDSAIRWFEDTVVVSPEPHDEKYINHSFEPTGLWHLGFIFALADLPAGTELTIDYRHLLAPGLPAEFRDSVTDQAVVGLPWEDSLRMTTRALAELLQPARR